MCLTVGTHLIPHPDKVHFLVSIVDKQICDFYLSFVEYFEIHFNGQVEKGGEDAFFVSSHGGGVIAVADGVSG